MVPKYKTSVHMHRKDVRKTGEKKVKPTKDFLTHKGLLLTFALGGKKKTACRPKWLSYIAALEWGCFLNSVQLSAMHHKNTALQYYCGLW